MPFKVVFEAFTFDTKEGAQALSDALTDAFMDLPGGEDVAATSTVVEVEEAD